jgi:hypothetical protein
MRELECHVKCPHCHRNQAWRAPVTQSVDVTVDADFQVVEIGFDVTEPDISKERVYCDYCGFMPLIDHGDCKVQTPTIGD